MARTKKVTIVTHIVLAGMMVFFVLQISGCGEAPVSPKSGSQAKRATSVLQSSAGANSSGQGSGDSQSVFSGLDTGPRTLTDISFTGLCSSAKVKDAEAGMGLGGTPLVSGNGWMNVRSADQGLMIKLIPAGKSRGAAPIVFGETSEEAQKIRSDFMSGRKTSLSFDKVPNGDYQLIVCDKRFPEYCDPVTRFGDKNLLFGESVPGLTCNWNPLAGLCSQDPLSYPIASQAPEAGATQDPMCSQKPTEANLASTPASDIETYRPGWNPTTGCQAAKAGLFRAAALGSGTDGSNWNTLPVGFSEPAIIPIFNGVLGLRVPINVITAYDHYDFSADSGGRDIDPLCATTVISPSPLVIDLEGRGIALTSPDRGVQFDIDGNGIKDPISWTVPGTGYFLVLDKNQNGNIDSVDEMFGDNTVGPDKALAANGFMALRKYDSNGDGRIDAHDPIFAELRLWSDTNMDGLSTPDELFSLKDKGIVAIDLNYFAAYEVDPFANETRQRSAVLMSDGSTRDIVDIWFKIYR